MVNDNSPMPMEESTAFLQQQDCHHYELAKKSIEAAQENNKILDAHIRTARRDNLVFAGVSLLLLLGFCTVAMFLDKENVALEVIKAGILVSAGGGAGFAIGIKKERKNQLTQQK